MSQIASTPEPATPSGGDDAIRVKVHELPGAIRESLRAVLLAHGYSFVDKYGALLPIDDAERLLRELANNAAQGVACMDPQPE